MEYLKAKSLKEESRLLALSHQHPANELGTTFVVVLRILKLFERSRKVKLFRGAIQLL